MYSFSVLCYGSCGVPDVTLVIFHLALFAGNSMNLFKVAVRSPNLIIFRNYVSINLEIVYTCL